jgi:hypothetical protein
MPAPPAMMWEGLSEKYVEMTDNFVAQQCLPDIFVLAEP